MKKRVKNDYPTVSVVMATYNGEKYLRAQLDSIVAQEYPVYELIVQDDGSTDKTLAMLRAYEEKFPFVHVYENDHNLGYAENFHTGCQRATGEYVALADQDDIWFPKKLSAQVAAIGRHDLCYCQHLRGESLEGAHPVRYKCAPERQMFAGIIGCSLLMRRQYAQDHAHWLGYMGCDTGLAVLAHFGRGVAVVDEPLLWHRQYDASVSSQEHLSQYDDRGHTPSWQPYVYGLANYWAIQRKPNFRPFYQRLLKESKGKNRLVHTLAALLLSRNPLALLPLCVLCMAHRRTIYPTDNIHGLGGLLRGFFFPFIHAYHCTFYDN